MIQILSLINIIREPKSYNDAQMCPLPNQGGSIEARQQFYFLFIFIIIITTRSLIVLWC